MLQPSPEYQEHLDLIELARAEEERLERERILNEKIEARAIRHEQARIRTLKFLSSSAMLLTGFVGIPVSIYAEDVRVNQEIQSHASIEINVVGQAANPANNNKAILFVDGFGTNNGDEIARFIGGAVPPTIDGQRWSMNLNNADPNNKTAIVQEIVQTAQQQGVDDLAIITHSAGGNIMGPVIAPLIRASNITVSTVTFDSTPYDVEALRPARQDEVDLVKKAVLIPGVEDSSYVREASEIILRSDNYSHGDNIFENISNFITTKNDVEDKLNNNQLPGMRLMIDQLLSIQKTDFKNTFKDISELPKDEVKPVIIYAKTAKPGFDPIVDVEKTEKELAADAKATGLTFIPLDIPGEVHTRPDLATDAYKKTFAYAGPEIQADEEKEAERASLHRVTSQMPYDPSKLKDKKKH